MIHDPHFAAAVITYTYEDAKREAAAFATRHPTCVFDQAHMRVRGELVSVYFRAVSTMEDAYRMAGFQFQELQFTDERIPDDVRAYLRCRVRTFIRS